MERASHELLAGTRLALDQHGRAHGRDLLDLHEHFLDGRGLPNDPGTLLKVAAFYDPSYGRGHLGRVCGLTHPGGEPEAPREPGRVRLRGFDQTQRGDGAVPRQCHDLARRGFVQRASQYDAVRIAALDALAEIFERRRQRRLESGRLELRVDPDGRL